MDRYIIETPHTHGECVELLDQLLALGYLNNFEWGCTAGVHSGWAIIEAESASQARMAVPALVRGRARVVKLNSFTDEDVRAFHASE